MPSRQDHIKTTVARAFDMDVQGVSNSDVAKARNGIKVIRRERTKQIIKTIHEVLTYCEKTIEKDIDDLTPLQRVTVWLNLQEYVRPKLSRVEQTGQDGGPMRHNHTIVLRSSAPMLTDGEPQLTLTEHGVNELPYEIAPDESKLYQPISINKNENNEMQTKTKTVSASFDKNGHVIYNMATITDIPPISDDEYVNTIPETEAKEI